MGLWNTFDSRRNPRRTGRESRSRRWTSNKRFLECLEDRTMLSTLTWIGGARR